MTSGSQRYILIGGGGFIGSHLAAGLVGAGREVIVVDRTALPAELSASGARNLQRELLTDDPGLPEGHVVILLGSSHPRPRWPWTLALDNVLATARILGELEDREVTLLSSVEVYGSAPGPLHEATPALLPIADEQLRDWAMRSAQLGERRCDPWRVAEHCRALTDADPSGRWVYGLCKRAQELMLTELTSPSRLRVLRLGNVFGLGQHRVLANFVRRALLGSPLTVRESTTRSFLAVGDVARLVLHQPPAGIYNAGTAPITLGSLAELVCELIGSTPSIDPVPSQPDDSSGEVTCEALAATGFAASELTASLSAYIKAVQRVRPPYFAPPLAVVVPPRSPYPERLADRQQEALWSGRVKHGQRWSKLLTERMRDVTASSEVLVTTSGTEALRLAVAGTAGPAEPGDVAILPSFTFPATAEVLVQLGYELVFVDVEPSRWTLDPEAVDHALRSHPAARLVVCVDTFGNPCDYAALGELCAASRITLVADSAASLGSRWADAPIGTQADAHAFSMSFAKVVSAAGAGGAVSFRRPPRWNARAGWARSALMDELHAVAALEQLELLPELIGRRESIAAIYGAAIDAHHFLDRQEIAHGARHSWVHWVLSVAGGASWMRTQLAAAGVETRDYFRALHLAAPYADRSSQLPVTERLHDDVCALPMSSELTIDQAECVALAIAEACRERAAECPVRSVPPVSPEESESWTPCSISPR